MEEKNLPKKETVSPDPVKVDPALPEATEEVVEPVISNIQPDNTSEQPSGKFPKIPWLALIVITILIAAVGLAVTQTNLIQLPSFLSKPVITPPASNSVVALEEKLVKFTTQEEFKEYLAKSEVGNNGYGSFFGRESISMPMQGTAPNAMATDKALPGFGSGEGTGRVSETNVQVKGIDEPDIVKTNGKTIFYSGTAGWVMPFSPRIMEDLPSRDKYTPPQQSQNRIKTINVSPLSDLTKQANLEDLGEMLLVKDLLVIFSGDKIIGVDVSNPQTPSQKWQINMEKNQNLVTARLKDDQIYLILRGSADPNSPCPIVPLSSGDKKFGVVCTDIYHPISPIEADTVYTVNLLNPQNGEISKSVGVVGSIARSNVYMSNQAIYLSYGHYGDMTSYLLNFYKEDGRDLITPELLNKLDELNKMDISSQAKSTEIQVLISRHQQTIKEEDKLKYETEMQNRLKEYSKKTSAGF